MTEIFGLIGYPLSHSFSPAYFQHKFKNENIDAEYRLFEMPDIDQLHSVLSGTPGIRGLNVTIPFKQAVMPLLDALSPEAEAVGAVNCIDIRNAQLIGHNTDTGAFEESLLPLLDGQRPAALILGTGGASRAVRHALDNLGITYQLVSRTETRPATSYEEITPTLLASHHLIINTTPVGMYPASDGCPKLPYEALNSQHLLYDLVYNPEETKFMRLGRLQGAAVKNGLEMLRLQAEASWRIWTA